MSEIETKHATLKRLEKERLNMLGQLENLSQDAAEHRLVLQTLSKIPDDRRCYRIVGGVAVERTVSEVKPALETHATNIDELKKKLNEQLNILTDEIAKLKSTIKDE